MTTPPIPFNKPYLCGKELHNIAEAHRLGQLAGDGTFTRKCQQWLEKETGSAKVLLTNSCTAALEMAAMLVDIKPGDEVIMPSFTFVSTANAFVLRGGVPVFVDIRPDTLNLDEKQVKAAITPRTRVIAPVHYAGVGAEMDAITALASDSNIMVVEDAAQGLMSTYKSKALGAIGQMGTLSFHETKNIISGEGGALLINDRKLIERAEIIREKGTNRTQFYRGMVDKYRWLDIGSSFLPGEIIAAFLYAQLEDARSITAKRHALWTHYHDALEPLEKKGRLRRPVVPDSCGHNAHIYYILLENEGVRAELIEWFKARGIHSLFHYVPLHSAPAGLQFGRVHGRLTHTENLSSCLLRLPLWIGLEAEQPRVIEALEAFFLNK